MKQGYSYRFGSRGARSAPYLLLAPGLLLYLVIALGPSVATAAYSFTDASGILGSPIKWIGLDNYKEFLLMGANVRDNLQVTENTFLFCILVTVVQTVFGLAAAILLDMRMRLSNFFRTVYFMPTILGFTIVGLVWSLFLYPMGGPMQRLLGLLGLQSEFLGGASMRVFYWIVWIQIWANMGVTMIIFMGGLQTVPAELREAARIDGAGSWQVFRHVTFPLLTPSLNTNILLEIIGSLQAWQLFLVVKGPTNGINVLSIWVYALAFGRQSNNPTGIAMRQGYGAAASMVLFVIVLVVGMITQRVLARREGRILG
jgi:raffinose/stachyose/melibiose transport system permease protein